VNYTPEQVSLLAACLAAITSVITLIISLVANISASKSSEMRVSYRQSLEKYLPELSDAIHSTLATSKILTQAKTETALQNWRSRAETAQAKLKELRVILRYPLWGITDALNTLTRLSDWIEHARGFPESEKEIFEKGGKLGEALDYAIRNSYNYGRPPTYLEKLRVRFAQVKLENVYNTLKEKGKKEVSNAE
jgi:hypothetical protein